MKQPKTFAGESNELSRDEMAFHHSFKPRWGPMDSLITTKNDMRNTKPAENEGWEKGISITSEDRDIIVLGYNKVPEVGLLTCRIFVSDSQLTVYYSLVKCLTNKGSSRLLTALMGFLLPVFLGLISSGLPKLHPSRCLLTASGLYGR